MDLQAWANIGEFLGGLAIFVSLIYLVINVRQNTSQLRENLRSLERTEMRSTYEQHDRYRLAMLDPEIAELWTKALEGYKRHTKPVAYTITPPELLVGTQPKKLHALEDMLAINPAII